MNKFLVLPVLISISKDSKFTIVIFKQLIFQNIPTLDAGKTLVTVQFPHLREKIQDLQEITDVDKTPYINATRLPKRKEW